MTNIDRIVKELEEEKEKIRVDAENRMGILHEAILILLETKDKVSSKVPISVKPSSNDESSISVTKMLEILVGGMDLDNVWDSAKFKSELIILYPTESSKIMTGIYNAINTLIAKKLLIRCPGGWKRFVPGVIGETTE